MTDDQTPAPAEQKSTSKAKQTHEPENVRLTKFRSGATLAPAAVYKGNDAPRKGDTLRFTLANGVTYEGIVAEAVVHYLGVVGGPVDDTGEVIVEFKDGIAPVRKK